MNKILFVTDGTEFSDMLIDKLESLEGIKLVIREGAEDGVPILQTGKGRFQGKGILVYIEAFGERSEKDECEHKQGFTISYHEILSHIIVACNVCGNKIVYWFKSDERRK